MKTLGVIANCSKKHAPSALARIGGTAKALGLTLLADPDTAKLLPGSRKTPASKLATRAEAVVALGGDGTMLRVARELAGTTTPMIGIKIGGLGFLTSVAESEIDGAIESLARNRYKVTTRSVMECSIVRRGKTISAGRALNDIVIGADSSRVATLAVRMDGEEVTSYVCDGLIVSTPTGSTGHSLSAGGPIITPASNVFVVSLICPHTLSTRPLVVPDRSVLETEVVRFSGKMLLTVDGQTGFRLDRGDRVRMRRGARGVRFIQLPGYSYFSVLRQKLNWSGSSLNAS